MFLYCSQYNVHHYVKKPKLFSLNVYLQYIISKPTVPDFAERNSSQYLFIYSKWTSTKVFQLVNKLINSAVWLEQNIHFVDFMPTRNSNAPAHSSFSKPASVQSILQHSSFSVIWRHSIWSDSPRNAPASPNTERPQLSVSVIFLGKMLVQNKTLYPT